MADSGTTENVCTTANDHVPADSRSHIDARDPGVSNDNGDDYDEYPSSFTHDAVYTHTSNHTPTPSYIPSYTGLIAPSRFSHSHNRSYNESASATSQASPSFSLFRPSVLSHTNSATNNNESNLVTSTGASLLKPARIPAPRSPSPDVSPEEVTSSTEASTTSGLQSSKEDTVSTSNGSMSCDRLPTNENYFTSSDIKLGSVPTTNGGFVFGKNLADRVTGVSSTTCVLTTDSNGTETTSTDLAEPPGEATEYVFGQNLAAPPSPAVTFSTEQDVDNSAGDKGACSLLESALDYQAKHENKTNLEEIHVMTGEENEANVLQANCKLYVHEKAAQNWLERGQGVLRLNDMTATDYEAFQSRLVMRTHGSYKLILNSKIWANMMLERANARSIRLSAMDIDDTIKVFLLVSNQKDSESIMSAVDWRKQKLQVLEDQGEGVETAPTGAEKRGHDDDKEESPKRFKCDKDTTSTPNPPDERIPPTEESTDSSVLNPETESSSGSRSSSALGRSESD